MKKKTEVSSEQRAKNNQILIPKNLRKMFMAHSQKEGAGFTVHRPIGGYSLSDQESDPFLLLDELGPVHYEKGEFEGAPWHPHRGFDTVMYMKKGEGKHQDSMGNSGVLKGGDVQWMTAGSGIIHDEGRDHPGGELHGFQLWINLPSKFKMCDPQYQQITGKNFPFIPVSKGVSVKCIAGKIIDKDKVIIESPIKPLILINYFDYNVEKGCSFEHDFGEIAEELKTVIVYIYQGSGKFYTALDDAEIDSDEDEIGNENKNKKKNKNDNWIEVKRTHTLYFGAGQSIKFEASANEDLGFLLLAGKPIKEKIARYGPFVMNTQEEIRKAFQDYQNGKLATVKGKSSIF